MDLRRKKNNQDIYFIYGMNKLIEQLVDKFEFV